MHQISFRLTARHLAHGPADIGWHPFRFDRIASTVLMALGQRSKADGIGCSRLGDTPQHCGNCTRSTPAR
jgi:hypothetical protein